MSGQGPPAGPGSGGTNEGSSADDTASGTIEDYWPFSGDPVADENAINKYHGVRLDQRLCSSLSAPSLEGRIRHLGSYCKHDDPERRTWHDVCVVARHQDVLSDDFATQLKTFALMFELNRDLRDEWDVRQGFAGYAENDDGEYVWTLVHQALSMPGSGEVRSAALKASFSRTVKVLGECPADRHCEDFSMAGGQRIACVRNDGLRDDADGDESDGGGRRQRPKRKAPDGSDARRPGGDGSSDSCGQHGRVKLRRTGGWDGGGSSRGGGGNGDAPIDKYSANVIVDADMHAASLEALIFDSESQRLVTPEKHITVSLNGQQLPLCVMPTGTHACEPLHQYRLHRGDRIEFTLGLLAASLPTFLDYGLTSLALKSCTG